MKNAAACSNAYIASVADILQVWARRKADGTACVFLQSGGVDEKVATYADLDFSAKKVADALCRDGVKPGDRVVLLFPSGLSFISAFFGCQYAGAIAAPAYPPLRNIVTLENIVKDCAPAYILSTAEIQKRVHAHFPESIVCRETPWKVVAFDASPGSFSVKEASGEAVALLQYTSGSTGFPKGVMLTHRNLIANIAAMQAKFGSGEDTPVVGWLPLYHDMGLIGNLLGSLYSGSPLYLMSPQDFIQEPFRWLDAISRYRARISGGPNFAYQLCLDRVTASQLSQLDLSNWIVAFNGAEPIRAVVLERFAEKFDVCRFSRAAFMPCYGMAESSLLVSCAPSGEIPLVRYIDKHALNKNMAVMVGRENEHAAAIVSCGRVIDDHLLEIVDPQSRTRCEQGNVGEIWIAGPSVTQGYWNKPSDDVLFSAISDAEESSQKYLRTGDLAFIQDEHLFITGRQKDVIILNGRNYYPQDIEYVVADSHADLKQDGTAAFEVEYDDATKLVIVQEITRRALKNFKAVKIVEAVCSAVSIHFQIEIHAIVFIGPHRLPKTSSNKVQRGITKKMYQSGDLQALFTYEQANRIATSIQGTFDAENEDISKLERDIRGEIAKILKIESHLLSTKHQLISLGIDSLSQLELTYTLEHRYGVSISVEQFFDGITIADIAKSIELENAVGAPS